MFACAPGSLRATFHAHDDPTDADVERLLRTVAARVRRWLRKHGRLRERDHDAPADDPEAAAATLLQTLGAAAVLGRTAQGPKAGADDVQPGRGSRHEPFERRPLTAESLHARPPPPPCTLTGPTLSLAGLLATAGEAGY